FDFINIHGIQSFSQDSETTIISINGNRFVSVLSVTHNKHRFELQHLSSAFNLKDWILRTEIEAEKIFCVLAHNSFVIYDWKQRAVISKFVCPAKCLLYSSLIIEVKNLSAPKALIAAGTVFKEVLIWEAAEKETKVIQRLTGHDGVIFSIHYCHKNNLLVSSSDDRSIRLYTYNCVDNEVESLNIRGKQGLFSFLAVLYGHESRIWQAVVCEKWIVSVGESSNFCLWDIDKLQLVYREEKFNDGSVWSLAVDNDRVFYAGSDACIKVRSFNDMLCPTNIEKKCFLETKPKSLGFVTLNNTNSPQLLISSENGHAAFFTSLNKSETLKINLGDLFRNYCIHCVHPLSKHILFANKFGDILKIDFRETRELFKAHDSKIFSLFYVSNETYLSCSINGELKLWTDLIFVRKHILPYSKYRWPTCGVYLNEKILIVGDRSGSVTVFNTHSESLQYFQNIHGDNGVTDLKIKPNSEFLYSCGRNGKIFEYLFHSDQETIKLLRVVKLGHEVDWIAKLTFDLNHSNCLCVLGFISTRFVLLNEMEQSALWSVECGGGHRSWDFTVQSNLFHFSYVKQNEIFWHTKKVPTSCQTLDFNSNSARINSGLFLRSKENVNIFFFAIAGDDNDVNILKFDISKKSLQKEISLTGHISNVKAMSSIDFQDFTLFVTVGGRSQMMIWKLFYLKGKLIAQQLINHFLWNIDGRHRKPWKDAMQVLDPQTRYMNVELKAVDSNNYLISIACSDAFFRLFLFNIEDNFIQLIEAVEVGDYCVLTLKSTKKVFICGANDGILRFWLLDENNLNKICEDSISDNKLKSPKPLSMINGLFCPKKRHQSILKHLHNYQSHQSGINSLDCYFLTDELLILLTGGDDASLKILLIDSVASNKILATTSKPNAHSSSITGVLFLNSFLFITTSTDQRVILWKLVIDIETKLVEVLQLEMKISCVADIAGCNSIFISDETVLISVFGEGFQFYEIDLKENKFLEV
ncbi:WD repeat-containing protein 6-like protein, partial [Dinothrombium tinctorium]